EDRAVNEIAHRVFSDAAIRHHVVGTAIARDDAVEDAGMRRAIELNEELLHTTQGGAFPTRPYRELYLGLYGCFALFEPETTSSTVGFLPSARAIDSLVAW